MEHPKHWDFVGALDALGLALVGEVLERLERTGIVPQNAGHWIQQAKKVNTFMSLKFLSKVKALKSLRRACETLDSILWFLAGR